MNAKEVLKRYVDEDLPEFIDVDLEDVNQRGNFGNTPLHVACVRGKLDEIEALLVAGADINIRGELDNTCLHDAAGQGYIAVVKKLLEYGALVDAINSFGDTAKDIALHMNYQDIAAVLEDREK